MKTKDTVDILVDYINDHYEKNFTVKDLAMQFAISPDYFAKLFKKSTGQSFIEYVNGKRIDAACKMLLSSQSSVTEIAQSIGYQDIQYFYKLFRKIMKMTPLEYKRRPVKQDQPQ